MMSILYHHFPVSGIDTCLLLPPIVMFFVSSLASPAGVSGAFILLPFQMSVLGYTSPGVSATNFVYNIVSIPLGLFRYMRNRQLSWALFSVIVIGTLPGVFLGYYIRMVFLPDPYRFRIFVAMILIYLAIKTIKSAYYELTVPIAGKKIRQFIAGQERAITEETLGFTTSSILFDGHRYSFSTPLTLIVSLIVGIVGGTYGIGGGAIMAPFCISVLELPVYIVSGAALFSTWITSIVAVGFYSFVSIAGKAPASPDLLLGILFGMGGMAGIYLGARVQKWLPSKLIKTILGIILLFISISYLYSGLRGVLS